MCACSLRTQQCVDECQCRIVLAFMPFGVSVLAAVLLPVGSYVDKIFLLVEFFASDLALLVYD